MSKLITTPTMGETVKRLLRSQMAEKNVDYRELTARLEEFGVYQNVSTLRTKVATGTMGVQLFLYIQLALGVRRITIEQVRDIFEDALEDTESNTAEAPKYPES
jgi:hypothetical protein